MPFALSATQVEQFNRDGYLVVRKLFGPELMDLLLRVARSDPHFVGRARGMADAAGRESKIALTTQLADSIYAAFVHAEKIVRPMEQLLEGQVYHLHHKMMLKEPKVGGAWEWHQDYGYWYNDGFLLPEMGSCMIAVDRATQQNGCLQVLRGSHLLGRVAHGRFGQQTGADPKRVEKARQRLPLDYFEAEPGDALFFHCNTLHCSAPNTSEFSRWSLICCYATVRNQPYVPAHAAYQFLEPWSDERIAEMGRQHQAALQAV
jgi:ectoine hydroxylase